MVTSLFILSRTPDLNSDNQVRDLDPGGVCRSSSPSGCRTHGGTDSNLKRMSHEGDRTPGGCTPQGSFFDFPPFDSGRDT